MDFLSYMQVAVFDPLGMKDTIADWANRDIPNRAKFYRRASEEPREVGMVDNGYKWAGGGFLSTPSDLVRFGSAHLEPGLLTEESLKTIFTPQSLNDGELTNYGIGWRILTPNEEREHAVYCHGGALIGGRAILAVSPVSGLVVAMLANVSNHPYIGEDNVAIAGAFASALLVEAAER